jgi:hypothetical protein
LGSLQEPDWAEATLAEWPRVMVWVAIEAWAECKVAECLASELVAAWGCPAEAWEEFRAAQWPELDAAWGCPAGAWEECRAVQWPELVAAWGCPAEAWEESRAAQWPELVAAWGCPAEAWGCPAARWPAVWAVDFAVRPWADLLVTPEVDWEEPPWVASVAAWADSEDLAEASVAAWAGSAEATAAVAAVVVIAEQEG